VAAVHSGPHPPADWEHNSNRHLIRIVPPIPGLWNCAIHSDCTCNEIISAVNRVLGVVPLPTERGLKEIKFQCDRAVERIGLLEPWHLAEVVESFKGPRRKRYQQAYDSLQVDPLVPADARISAFVKAEKFNPEEKENPDPRMIQARSPRYNLVIAKYLRPIEHYIYNLRDELGIRMVAKGLNQSERARLLKEKFEMFDDPVCFSIDASRWDKHVSKEVLQLEHRFYLRLHGGHPELDRLLKWQLKNKCVTSNGVKYTVDGGRMSGDINTALGNVLLMVLMVLAAMKALFIKKFQIANDGDDCLIIVERSSVCKIDALPAKFLEYGQELKVENVTSDIRKVVFCQSQMVSNGQGDIMLRNWRKILSHGCCGTKHWNDRHMVRPMMGLVGRCELALCAGIPICQEYALACIRNSKGKIAKFETLQGNGLLYRLGLEYSTLEDAFANAKQRPVTRKAREDFEKAFDTPIWEQLEIERILRDWNIESTDAVLYPMEWDSSWEDWTHPDNIIPDIY